MGSGRIAALPLATSDKDTSAQSRESILGKADETAGAIEPDASDGIDNAPGEASPERVAAADPAVGDTVPLPAETAEVRPTFDVVSIDPDGTAVVAGRAAPGASVTLQIGDKAIGTALASDHGEWVIIPDELILGGAQSLSLAATPESGGESVQSDQVATIVLPDNASDTASGEVAVEAPRTSSAKEQPEQIASADGAASAVSIPEQAETQPSTIVANAQPAPVSLSPMHNPHRWTRQLRPPMASLHRWRCRLSLRMRRRKPVSLSPMHNPHRWTRQLRPPMASLHRWRCRLSLRMRRRKPVSLSPMHNPHRWTRQLRPPMVNLHRWRCRLLV